MIQVKNTTKIHFLIFSRRSGWNSPYSNWKNHPTVGQTTCWSWTQTTPPGSQTTNSRLRMRAATSYTAGRCSQTPDSCESNSWRILTFNDGDFKSTTRSQMAANSEVKLSETFVKFWKKAAISKKERKETVFLCPDNEFQGLGSGQVWGHTPKQRVAASTLWRYSFGLRLAIAQADARPVMPISFR